MSLAQAGDAKKALHEYYREVVSGNVRLTRQEKKLRRALYGAWESVYDSIAPKDVSVRTKLAKGAAIQKHGLLYKKKSAVLHYTIGDSLRKVPWLWNVQKDTIIYGVALPHMMGDTIIIKEVITNLTPNRIELKTVGRDTITSAVACGEESVMRATRYSGKPVYAGNMQQYLEDGLKYYNPPGEYYHATLKFIVNCKGEVLKVYPFPASYDEFERIAAKLIRNSGKWLPASMGGKTYDAEVYVEISWKKGFIDFDFPSGNY